MTSVFLSHSSKDKAFTRKLAERLVQAGVQVWLDEAELNVGDSLIQSISSAIGSTDYMAVIISHNSVQSSWVQTELQMAMTRELADKKVRVLPIVIEPCELPMFLRDKLYADFSKRDDFDAPFAKLLRAFGVDKTLAEIQPTATHVIKQTQSQATTPNKSSLAEFIDIQIIGVDRERTYNPNPEYTLFNIYLMLSAYPPQEWVNIFNAERRFPRHTMWRNAWIDGKNIVVYCATDEIKKYHLPDLKQDVSTSNQKYREELHRVELRKAVEAQKRDVQKQALVAALDDLEF